MPQGNGPQPRATTGTGPRNYKSILVVTPLAFCVCDWSILHVETLLREYSWAEVKLPSIDRPAVTKRLGITALVYIFQTLVVDIKDCL